MNMIFPNKKYNIIYADPPWEYRDRANAGNRGSSHKYTVQDLKWIKSLPIPSITSKNCALFLWVTMPQLPNAFEVIKSWGFVYKTCAFTWVKRNKVSPSYFTGMGHYTRANPELCLLATTKKTLKRVDASVHSIIDTPIERHSKKPDETKTRIVQLFGDLPRIELFARQTTKGWDSWGNESPLTIDGYSFG